jgi:large conductance mechanosensitive channel
MQIFREFKEFAVKGNAVDLAVGVIIGAAFGKIVSSLVSDVIMPPIGKVMGGVDFKDLFISLDPAKTAGIKSLAKAKESGAAIVAYGQFINVCIDFLIVAFCIFLVVKGMNAVRRGRQPATTLAPTTKECPECLSTIPIKAKRCSHCGQAVP